MGDKENDKRCAKSVGKYSCVPYSTSSSYDKDGKKTGLSFFKFPTEKRKPRWLNLIKRQENKKPDMLKVTEYTEICEEHFEREDITFRLNRKYLNPDAEHKHFDC